MLSKCWLVLVVIAICVFPSPATAQDFVRGDCNIDGAVDIGDAVSLLAILFSGATPSTCSDACDVNDDGQNDIGDAIYCLAFLFSMGPAIPAPSPTCGPDPTADALDCQAFPLCTTPLSHAADVQPIWDINCTFCHGGPAPFAGLDLETNAFANTVDVPATECSSMDFIEPGLPDSSWIYRKILGTHTAMDVQALGCVPPVTGSMMPPGAFCCPTQQEVDTIRDWILQGANP